MVTICRRPYTVDCTLESSRFLTRGYVGLHVLLRMVSRGDNQCRYGIMATKMIGTAADSGLKMSADKCTDAFQGSHVPLVEGTTDEDRAIQ